MHDLMLPTSANVPAPLINAGPKAKLSFLKFFTANIRDPNTRKATCGLLWI